MNNSNSIEKIMNHFIQKTTRDRKVKILFLVLLHRNVCIVTASQERAIWNCFSYLNIQIFLTLYISHRERERAGGTAAWQLFSPYLYIDTLSLLNAASFFFHFKLLTLLIPVLLVALSTRSFWQPPLCQRAHNSSLLSSSSSTWWLVPIL